MRSLMVILASCLLLVGALAGAPVTATAQAASPDVFTVQGTQLISPEGKPVKLTGWRIDSNAWSVGKEVSPTELKRWDAQGLLGNAQAVEIWWSQGIAKSPSERYPDRPGVYEEAAVAKLLSAMRNIARSGSWVIPSIRVSYDQSVAIENTRRGTTSWQGWADHRKVIYNDPVVVEQGVNAGTYGKHRDRFFAWLDWLIPKILADKEIAERIAYWEMWHYFGHKQTTSAADRDHYLDDFMPRLIAKYREHDPDRLLGVGATLDDTVNQLVSRLEAGTWKPYQDKNWIYVVGGYGILGVLMRSEDTVKRSTWPVDSKNPSWIADSEEFNIEKLARLSGRALHSQEGPGLRERFRETPIPELQRTWLTGLFNLYNAKANGFAFHAWPPSWANQKNRDPLFGPTQNFDETDFFKITRQALKGNQVDQD